MADVNASPRLVEGQLQFPAPAFAADRTECSVAKRVAKRGTRRPFERKSESRGEARCSKSARRIVVKASRIQHAKASRCEVFETPVEIDDWHRLIGAARIEKTGQRVDAEVSPSKIFFEAAGYDVGKRARMGIGFTAQSREIELCISRHQSQRAKAIVRLDFDFPVIPLPCDLLSEFSNIGFDHDVDVGDGATEKQIADRSSNQMNAKLLLIGDRDNFRKQFAGRLRNRCENLFETETPLHRFAPDPRGCLDSTVFRSFERLTCV